MDILVGKLNNIYQSETIDEAYNTCSKLINYETNDDKDTSDYNIEYEHLFKWRTDFDMKLPDPELTFKLLDGANLFNDDRKLVLTLGNDMKFENMKISIKIFIFKNQIVVYNPCNYQQQRAIAFNIAIEEKIIDIKFLPSIIYLQFTMNSLFCWIRCFLSNKCLLF